MIIHSGKKMKRQATYRWGNGPKPQTWEKISTESKSQISKPRPWRVKPSGRWVEGSTDMSAVRRRDGKLDRKGAQSQPLRKCKPRRQHTQLSEWPMAMRIPTKRQRNTSNNTHLWESEAESPGWENVRCLSSPCYLSLLLGWLDKWPTESSLEKKDSSVLHFTVYHWAIPRPEIKAGAWRRNHEGTLLSGLFTEAWAAALAVQLRALPTVTWASCVS